MVVTLRGNFKCFLVLVATGRFCIWLDAYLSATLLFFVENDYNYDPCLQQLMCLCHLGNMTQIEAISLQVRGEWNPSKKLQMF